MGSETYKPTEHDGLKKDGTEDKRVGTGEFAYGKVDPHEAGQTGGHTSGSGDGESTRSQGNTYKPSEHDGLKENGEPDGRMNNSSGGNSGSSGNKSGNSGNNSGGNSGGSAKGEFAHGKVDPSEAGKKGGKSSGNTDDE